MSDYLLISDAAREVKVESHVLRYWEEELHLPIKRNELGHRFYTVEDVERFRQIKSLKERGLQLKAIKMILKDGRLDYLGGLSGKWQPEDSAGKDMNVRTEQKIEKKSEADRTDDMDSIGKMRESGDDREMQPQMGIEIVESRDFREVLKPEPEDRAKRLQWILRQMMQDGKALQSGTSHFLGQNFAKAFDVTYINKENKPEYVWATSWGVSTRLMGALIMTHSDDNGLVLPPHLAPIQVVIVPIYKDAEGLAKISERVDSIVKNLRAKGISVKYDDADNKRPGFKFADYEVKGVPVRLALGARDLENGTVEVMRRDTLEKETLPLDGIEETVVNMLEDIQKNLLEKARKYREEMTTTADTYEEFKEKIEKGGFILAHWDGTPETEEKIKEETKATIRCIPFEGDTTPGVCMVTGKPSARRVIFARSY